MTNIEINAPENKLSMPFRNLDVGDFFVFLASCESKRIHVKVAHREYITLSGVEKGANHIDHEGRNVLIVENVTISYE